VQLWVNRTLEHMIAAKDYNCTGLYAIHWRTGVTSPAISAMAEHSWNSSLVSHDYWVDWAAALFGPGDNSIAIADLFSSIESFNLPQPANWITGPGTLAPGNCGPASAYDFVDTLVRLRAGVVGVPELAEFDYWMNQFLYMQAINSFQVCAILLRIRHY